MKRCSKCKVEKPLSDFARNKDKLDGWCKQCKNLAQKQRRILNRQQWSQIDRRAQLKRLYKITMAEYNAKLKSQGGVCAICGNPPKVMALHVDHAHNSKVFRGLLCNKCNRGLGMFEDDADRLEKAAQYLRRLEVANAEQRE